MKKIKQMPTDRQFIAVWSFDDKIWCDTVSYCPDEEDFLVWDHERESYLEKFSLCPEAEKTVKYFILG